MPEVREAWVPPKIRNPRRGHLVRRPEFSSKTLPPSISFFWASTLSPTWIFFSVKGVFPTEFVTLRPFTTQTFGNYR